MSHPLPGPMRPPSGSPKANVLQWYGLGALALAFSIATAGSGAWRLLALVPLVLCVVLLRSSFRARVADAKDDPPWSTPS